MTAANYPGNENAPKTRLSALPERHSAPSDDFMRALAAWQRLKNHNPSVPHKNTDNQAPAPKA